MKTLRSALLALTIACGLVAAPAAFAKPPVPPAVTPTLAVGPQYDTTHV
ncbi:TPA: glyoxalase, partial [Burkholderia ambifaria]